MREHVHLCEYACVCAAICMQTFIHQGTVLQYFSTMLCQCYFIPRSIVISSDANQPYRSIRLPDVHLEPGVRFESLDAQANHAQALCWVRLQIVDAWSVKFHSNQALAYKKKKLQALLAGSWHQDCHDMENTEHLARRNILNCKVLSQMHACKVCSCMLT